MQRSGYLVFLVVLVFFVISFLTNIIGPLVPDIIVLQIRVSENPDIPVP